MAFKLNKTEEQALKHLKKLKEKHGNPIEITVPKLSDAINKSEATTQIVMRILEANVRIERDLSNPHNPKVIVK